MNSHKRRAFLGRGLRLEHLESRSLLAGLIGESPWQNPLDSNDLDFDGAVSPSDALLAINAINSGVSGEFAVRFAPPQLQGEFEHAATAFLDADGDSALSPSDALTVINAINGNAAFKVDVPDIDQPGSIEEAHELSFNNGGFVRVRGVIENADDVDVFQVAVAKSRLHVALFSRGSGELTVTVVNASNETVDSAQIEEDSHRPAKLNLEVEAGSTYYLKVSGTGGPYALAVLNFDEMSFAPQPDSPLGQDIHGDTTGDATELNFNRGHAKVVSNIDGKAGGDADVFELTAIDGTLILTAIADFDLNVELRDSSGVLRTLTVSDRQAVAINVAAGTYFVTVTAANATDTGLYRLRVGNVPAPGGNHELPPGHPANNLVEEVFQRFDTDNNGKIDVGDLQNIAGPFSRIADSVFEQWDTDDDGLLTITEVTAGLSTLPPLVPVRSDHDGPGPLRRVFGLRLDAR